MTEKRKRGQRPRDEELLSAFASRFKQITKGESSVETVNRLEGIVGSNSIWDYRNGLSLPGPAVLNKIAQEYGVSVDWLLRGEESEVPRNAAEREALQLYRDAETAGVAEEVGQFARFAIHRGQQALPGVRPERPSWPKDIETTGERLRYFREAVLKADRVTFAVGLEVNANHIEDFERGKRDITAIFLTRLLAKYGKDHPGLLDFLLGA